MSTTSVVRSPPEDRLALWTVLTFVSAGIPSAILLGMLGVFLPRFFTHFHMQLFAIGGIAGAGADHRHPGGRPWLIGWATWTRFRTPLGRYRAWFSRRARRS